MESELVSQYSAGQSGSGTVMVREEDVPYQRAVGNLEVRVPVDI